ncbi:trypsin-like cysteine/serine peptidase domain-containing protein [Absidia repens]|uniref:Trypsin-like cysteine/serine peptidase domain-containing protein n=1 Tax=Absidia repens TaxID=90262 RepID=A0A1X2I8A7_9FUNG|nr:trypsin-like cysteine/serine peptidase domain-containing protein [Absidia repens]
MVRVLFLFLIVLFTTTSTLHGSPLSTVANKDAKIVGGKPVPSDQFPWELSIGLAKNQRGNAAQRQQAQPLYKESTHHCDGVLLSPEWVMTAGHCGVDENTHQPLQPKDLLVGFQSKDLDQVYDHGRLPVAEVIVHPQHRHGVSTSPNDITLLRLATPFPNQQGINTGSTATGGASAYACLPQPSRASPHYTGKLTSIGFGNTHALYYDLSGSKIVSGIQPSRYLKEIDVMDISDQSATNQRSIYCRGRPDLICITALQDPDSTCQGDSGGSLIYQGNLVIGITSFGDNKNYDATRQVTCIGDTAYTRLSMQTEWIRSHVPSVCLR